MHRAGRGREDAGVAYTKYKDTLVQAFLAAQREGGRDSLRVTVTVTGPACCGFTHPAT